MLFRELPVHLARMALFKVNTGCREQEVCGLRWDYEVKVPELETSVFIVPGEKVKNGQDRLVVLNRIARSVVDSQRGRHPSMCSCTYRSSEGEGRRIGDCAGAETVGGDEQHGVEACASTCSGQVGAANRSTGTGGLSESARARSEAHVRQKAARGGRFV